MTRHGRITSLLALVALCACATSAPRGGPAPASAPARGSSAGPAQDGIALYQQGRYAEAEAALVGATGATARAYLAASRVRLGRYAEAEAPALESLRADPAEPVAAAALGEALVAQGKLDEAIERLSAAVEAAPSLPYTRYWRGQAYQRRKQVARMVEDYEAFLRLAPNAPEAPAVRVLLDGLR